MNILDWIIAIVFGVLVLVCVGFGIWVLNGAIIPMIKEAYQTSPSDLVGGCIMVALLIFVFILLWLDSEGFLS